MSPRMYQPGAFAVDDPSVLQVAIREIAFGTVSTVHGDEVAASHAPFLLSDDGSRLMTHLARGNPQVAAIGGGANALVTFLGPNAYVSPGWYPTKAETGKVVPTWNYVAVHARGRAVTFDDPARVLALVRSLTDRHEAARERPWSVDDAPSNYIDGLLRAIVGVEIEVASLEGKWKLSQNRGEADRRGVASGLAAQGEAERGVAALMAALETRRPGS